jgi:hypothetical protein
MTALRFKPRQAPRIEILRSRELCGRLFYRLDFIGQDDEGEPFRFAVGDAYDPAAAIAAGSAWEAQGVAVDYSGALT